MNRIVKDALFGIAGGIAGTIVIGPVMGALGKLQSDRDHRRERQLVREQPTEKLAGQISKSVLRRQLSKDTKATMGKVVYWGYGIVWGGVYGLLRRRLPVLRWAAGLPFGVAFGLIGPAVLLPIAGLTPPATKFPVSAHARGLLSHYAYAATAESVCRLCERIDRQISQEQRRTKTELRRVS
jgi:uncharacterized membrane protein YagU involved in acid resistance